MRNNRNKEIQLLRRLYEVVKESCNSKRLLNFVKVIYSAGCRRSRKVFLYIGLGLFINVFSLKRNTRYNGTSKVILTFRYEGV